MDRLGRRYLQHAWAATRAERVTLGKPAALTDNHKCEIKALWYGTSNSPITSQEPILEARRNSL